MAEYPIGTAARMIRVAKDEIGVVEVPENKVKYNNNGIDGADFFIFQ